MPVESVTISVSPLVVTTSFGVPVSTPVAAFRVTQDGGVEPCPQLHEACPMALMTEGRALVNGVPLRAEKLVGRPATPSLPTTLIPMSTSADFSWSSVSVTESFSGPTFVRSPGAVPVMLPEAALKLAHPGSVPPVRDQLSAPLCPTTEGAGVAKGSSAWTEIVPGAPIESFWASWTGNGTRRVA